MANTLEMEKDVRDPISILLDTIHCPEHGMVWEACCVMKVSMELHNFVTAARKDEREAAALIAYHHDKRHDSGYRCHEGEIIANKIRARKG